MSGGLSCGRLCIPIFYAGICRRFFFFKMFYHRLTRAKKRRKDALAGALQFCRRDMCPDKKSPAENTCRIVKGGADAVWTHFFPSKPCPSSSTDSNVREERRCIILICTATRFLKSSAPGAAFGTGRPPSHWRRLRALRSMCSALPSGFRMGRPPPSLCMKGCWLRRRPHLRAAICRCSAGRKRARGRGRRPPLQKTGCARRRERQRRQRRQNRQSQ